MERWKRWSRRVQRVAAGGVAVLRRWILLAFASAMALGIGLVLFSPIVQVREIGVVRTDSRLDPESVQKILAPMFGHHLLFVTEREVAELLQEGLPDLESVKITKDYPSKLTVRIDVLPVVAVLDIVSPDEEAADTESGSTLRDYLLENGLYARYPAVEGGEPLYRIRIVDWGVRPAPGTMLITPEFLTHMRSVEQAFRTQFGLDVIERSVFIRAREYHLRVGTVSLWFDVTSSMEEQLARYRVFLSSVGMDQVKEYVDLRLADRVVYR